MGIELSLEQQHLIDSALQSDSTLGALSAIIWWCLDIDDGSNFLNYFENYPVDLIAQLRTSINDIYKPLSGRYGRTELIPLILCYAYEHGYFEQVLEVHKALCSIAREHFCYRPPQ